MKGPKGKVTREYRPPEEVELQCGRPVTVHPLLFADVRINTPRGIDLASAA